MSFRPLANWLVWSLLVAAPARAQVPGSPAEMFAAWCARCHGEDGRGRVAEPTVKTQPMDFSDCAVATAESDADWALVIARGGPAAGLSSEMPAFGDALDETAIRALVNHLRSFCREPGWPHGNLNLPRPIFTEKAFPENELVVLPAIAHGAGAPWTGRLRAVFERRVGRRSHVELALPLESVARAGGRATGVGDVAVGLKRVVHASAAGETGRIVTVGFELSLPTGSRARQLGAGVAVAEPYLALGWLRSAMHVQAELKVEAPLDGLERELALNVYCGRDLAARPDTWTLGIELNGTNETLALTPQIRKGVTRTGALAAAAGIRLPLVGRDIQPIAWVGYLLWEYLEPIRARR